MPHTACDGGNMTKLYKLISDNFESTPISTVQRKYFNETKGVVILVVFLIYFTILLTSGNHIAHVVLPERKFGVLLLLLYFMRWMKVLIVRF